MLAASRPLCGSGPAVCASFAGRLTLLAVDGRYTAAGTAIIRVLSLRMAEAHISPMAQPAFDYRHLSIDERLQLVEDIWDSIAQEANVRAEALPLSPAQMAELERRIADADAHPDDGIPWEQVRAELLERGG